MNITFQSINKKELPAELLRLKAELRILRKELALTHSGNLRVERNLHFLIKELLPEIKEHSEHRLLQRSDEIPSKEAHYGRNLLMPVSGLPQSPEEAAASGWDTSVSAASRKDPIGHFYQDVLPWLLWGNDTADSTDMHQRLKAFVLYGGIEAAQSPVKTQLT